MRPFLLTSKSKLIPKEGGVNLFFSLLQKMNKGKTVWRNFETKGSPIVPVNPYVSTLRRSFSSEAHLAHPMSSISAHSKAAINPRI